jgi:multiple sugar transport system ATP-binding protein
MNFFDGAVKMLDGRMVFEEGKLENARVAGAKGQAAKNGNGQSDEPVVLVGELTLPGSGFRLPVPDRLKERLGGAVGKHVVLGIRPEHFHLRPVEGAESASVQVKLNVVEPLGNDMDVYMSTSLHDHVVGRVEAQPGLATDTQVTMYADLRKVHFFEPGETGMNLSLNGTAGGGSAPAGRKSEPTHAVA